MLWPVALAFAASLVVAVAAPRLARLLPPATATVLLITTELAAAGATMFVLADLAFTWIAQAPPVAREGDWSPILLRGADPVPATVAVFCGAVVIAGVASVLRSAGRRIRAYRRLDASIADLAHDGGVVVVDSPRADAYATPAAGGRIVITRNLLDALEPGESRALIAHERAHLRLRHVWWKVAADLTAAANPLLRPIAAAVAETVERWADEHAAVTVGDRRLVARALARAALCSRTPFAPAPALGALDGQMPRRVDALLAPPPRRRLVPLAALLILLAAVASPTVAVGTRTDTMFDKSSITSR